MAHTKYYGKRLVRAVQRGDVPEAVIDEAARRIVRTILMFADAPDPLGAYPESLIASDEHVQLALEVAEKSIVLLKNEGATLPFERERVKKVALLGPRGDYPNIGDHGSSRVFPPYVVTPLDGLRKVLGSAVEILYEKGKDLDRARQFALEADAVVFVVGYDHRDEGEYVEFLGGLIKQSGDRDDLRLHEEDVRLIQAVGSVNPNTAVVLIGGSAIMMEEWKDRVPAILHAFYPGMEGGTAIAKVLFGEVNPGGKLPFTIPTDVSHLPPFDKHASRAEYDMYHGYTRLDKEGHAAAFPFGFGLSYTSFRQANASFAVDGDQVVASVDVTNTGSRAGDQVVQFYVGFENSAVDRPRKLLRGFQRVTLQPGETRRVTITCPVEKLRWYNPEASSWELEHMEYQAYIGFSSREQDLLHGTFSL
ncbi:MAG: glycoside hydrolase family 3 C-terminal domain-containing protein, partial [Anaerolineae bacterium]|nr:glycoside hydrolase family 3 C-terminal domain-containing protein [Anaerolineae bacterium]